LGGGPLLEFRPQWTSRVTLECSAPLDVPPAYRGWFGHKLLLPPKLFHCSLLRRIRSTVSCRRSPSFSPPFSCQFPFFPPLPLVPLFHTLVRPTPPHLFRRFWRRPTDPRPHLSLTTDLSSVVPYVAFQRSFTPLRRPCLPPHPPFFFPVFPLRFSTPAFLPPSQGVIMRGCSAPER